MEIEETQFLNLKSWEIRLQLVNEMLEFMFSASWVNAAIKKQQLWKGLSLRENGHRHKFEAWKLVSSVYASGYWDLFQSGSHSDNRIV